MAQNIEIKAHARNFLEQSKIANAISDVPRELLVQQDTFYQVTQGRLKLRRFADHSAELIYYLRGDIAGPKLSQYRISKVSNPDSLHEILSDAYGVIAQVEKRRILYKVGRTRLHFDEVAGLGQFIELEVVLSEGESLDRGQIEAERLTAKLGIQSQDLIDVAYVDLLQRSA